MLKKVIIIGGGILGASTAYELALQGVEVVVIDREDIGQATKAAAGIICPWNSQRRNKRWYVLAKEGAKYYPHLVEQLSGYHKLDIGYKKVGALCLHSEENKLKQMQERTLKRKLEAPEIGNVSILSSSEAKELFPLLTNDFHALHISGAARVDGWAMRNALIEASKILGAKYIQSDAQLTWAKNKITGVRLKDQTVILSDKVLITAGVWANELLKPLQLNFDVTTQKGQIMHISIPNTNCNNWPVVMPPHDQYLLTLKNRIVIGATHENISDFNSDVTLSGLKEMMDKAFLYAPELVNSKLEEIRVGYRPFTADFLPIFGKVEQYEGLFMANGLGASGLTMGPFIGQQLAHWLLKSNTVIDFEDYTINSSIKEL